MFLIICIYVYAEAAVEGEDTKAEGEKEEEEEEDDGNVKGIPGFWLTCLTSHPTIGELITEDDIPCLEALSDVTCSYDADFKSFTLTFYFAENDWFSNTVSNWLA